MDYIIDNTFDLVLENGRYQVTINHLKNIIYQALFTDARVNNQRGFWIDINNSELWLYTEQGRKNSETYSDIRYILNNCLINLLNQGYFINFNIDFRSNVFYINIKTEYERVFFDIPLRVDEWQTKPC